MRKILLVTLFSFSLSSFADHASIDAALQFKRIGNIAIAPDGNQIAYTTSEIVSVADGKERDYYLNLSDRSGHATQLLKSEYVTQPAWSPDGKSLAYLNKSGKEQAIKIYNTQTHKTTTLIALTGRNISAFKWSPNGKFIAYVADDMKIKKSSLLTPINVDNDYTNARIYVETTNPPTTTPAPVTSNQISIAQVYNPTVDGGFDWSPDSNSIAFAYQPRAGANETRYSKVAILSLLTHQVTEIPYMQTHVGFQPVYSPDGQWIAFHSNLTGSENEKLTLYSDPFNNGQICVTHTADLTTHCLAPTFNENPMIASWSASGHSLYAIDMYKTLGPQIYELDLNPATPVKQISQLHGYIEESTFAVNARHNYFAFGFETTQQAPEIFLSSLNPYKFTQITHLQTPSTTSLGKSSVIHWLSSDHAEIEGLLITPANYDDKKEYPLIVDIHGGPANVAAQRYIGGCDEGGDMILPACMKTWLDLGFVIFQPNYRGSTGYGKSFRAANVSDLGGGDYQDVMTGVDSLIKQGIADSNHLAVFGWSYGGYLTAWAVTQSHRFKAAVEGSGLTDLISFSGTSDIPYYLQYYLDNSFWNNNKLYLQRSPILFTQSVTTPLLILHGSIDLRVPVTQSYEFFAALKAQNKPVEMLLNPEQEHILTDGNIIYQNVVAANDWLEKAAQ